MCIRDSDWMCNKFSWDDGYRPDRGKVLGPAELDRVQKFARYTDVDGDGIAARTLPGAHPRGGYFTRGSGHDKNAAYTEDSAEYLEAVSYTHLRAHETPEHLVCRLL